MKWGHGDAAIVLRNAPQTEHKNQKARRAAPRCLVGSELDRWLERQHPLGPGRALSCNLTPRPTLGGLLRPRRRTANKLGALARVLVGIVTDPGGWYESFLREPKPRMGGQFLFPPHPSSYAVILGICRVRGVYKICVLYSSVACHVWD